MNKDFLQELIVEYAQTLTDLCRFRRVCREWCNALKSHPNSVIALFDECCRLRLAFENVGGMLIANVEPIQVMFFKNYIYQSFFSVSVRHENKVVCEHRPLSDTKWNRKTHKTFVPFKYSAEQRTIAYWLSEYILK